MKKNILIIMILFSFLPALAREPQRGYRGFLEWDNSFGSKPYFEHASGQDKNDFQWIAGISTTHGFQFNRHVFLGAGVMLAYGFPSLECTLPVFLDFRYDYSFNKFRPFGDLRLGYNFTDGGGIYFSPTIGHRFNWGRKFGVNIGAGITLRQRSKDVYRVDLVSFFPNPIDFDRVYLGRRHYTDTFFTLKFGFDF